MKLYLIHQITGLTPQQVYDYYEGMKADSRLVNYTILFPMVCKGYLMNETIFQPKGYQYPVSTDHAIFQRDNWMVHQADVLYADLTGASGKSLGACFELAWGWEAHKHIVTAMEDGNPNDHAFIRQASSIVLPSAEEALEYLSKLSWGAW